MIPGQASSSDPVISPSSDGGGTGVPDSNVFSNITGLANAVSVDVAGVYRSVNSPQQMPYTYRGPGQAPLIGTSLFSGMGLLPLLLIIGAVVLVFKEL